MLYTLKDQTNNKYYIGESGSVKLTEPIFDDCQGFIFGKCIVRIDGFYSILNEKLEYMIDFLYDSMHKDGDYYIVGFEGKTGLINKNGDLIIDIVYDNIYIQNGTAYLKLLDQSMTLYNINFRPPIATSHNGNFEKHKISIKPRKGTSVKKNIEEKGKLVVKNKGYHSRVKDNGFNFYNNDSLLSLQVYDKIDRFDNFLYLLWKGSVFQIYDTKHNNLLMGNKFYREIASTYEGIYEIVLNNNTDIFYLEKNSITSNVSNITYSNSPTPYIHYDITYGSASYPIGVCRKRAKRISSSKSKTSSFKLNVFDNINDKKVPSLLSHNLLGHRNNFFDNERTFVVNKKETTNINELPIVDLILC